MCVCCVGVCTCVYMSGYHCAHMCTLCVVCTTPLIIAQHLLRIAHVLT